MTKINIKINSFLFILALNSVYCKTQLKSEDCEKYYTPEILQGCNSSQPDLNLCLLIYSSYYQCKKDNSKKLYNKIEF